MGPLSGTDDGGPNGNAVRFHSPKDVIDDFLNGSSGHFFPAGWAVRFSNSRPKEAEVILDFRDGRHGGARVVTTLFLIDGNGGRKSLNGITVRFFHLSDELARIRRQALDVPPLTFCVEGIKGEARFTRSRYARNNDELPFWKIDGDVFEVVGSRPFDLNPAFLT